MSQIAYDPVKDKMAGFLRKNKSLRGMFYLMLDLFFLRSWYIRRTLNRWYSDHMGEARFAFKGLRVLDAGCGFGQYDKYILDSFPKVRVDAVDVKLEYLEDCKNYFHDEIDRKRIRFEQMDLLEPEFEKKYDLILCVDVLEHIQDDVKVMKNLAAVMKPDGYFLMHSPSHYASDDAGDDESFVGEHARAGYSKDELRTKLDQAGLTATELRYTYGFPGHTAWVMLVKWPMKMINRFGMAALFLLMLWYIVTLLPGLLLMAIDMALDHDKGTGILAMAKLKPE